MLASSVRAYYFLSVRFFVVILGGVAIVWGVHCFPIFWKQAAIEHIAQRIIRGEPYKIEVFSQEMPVIEDAENSTTCRPIALWSSSIIWLRMVEEDSRNEQQKPVNVSLLNRLDNSIQRSLSCSVAEPFLWLVLYWVESTKKNVKGDYAKYLKMSYQLGPNEGWIALKRNPVAFANYERLPPDLQSDVITEFLALIGSGFYQQAADIFSGPAWRLRNTILPQFANLPRRNQEDFVRTVRERGIDAKIPGIESPSQRP